MLTCCTPRLLELLVGQVSHLSCGPRKSGFPTVCQQLVSHLLGRPGYGYSFALDGAQCSSWFSLQELSKTLVLNVLHLSGACLLTRVSHFFSLWVFTTFRSPPASAHFPFCFGRHLVPSCWELSGHFLLDCLKQQGVAFAAQPASCSFLILL